MDVECKDLFYLSGAPWECRFRLGCFGNYGRENA